MKNIPLPWFSRALVAASMTVLLGGASIVRAADPTSEQTLAAIEKAVLAANAEMIAAVNRLDVDGFFEHIVDTDRGLIIQNGVIFRTRRDAYDAVKRGMQGVAKLDRRIDNPQVTVIGADAAVLVGDGHVTATLDDGRIMTSRFAVSLVFVRRDGRWKALHGHYSMPPDQRP